MKEWQLIGKRHWIFGDKVRGVVRRKQAEVYHITEYGGHEGCWRWLLGDGPVYPLGGYGLTLDEAVEAAEEALGLKEE